jgi:hypothetical protein
MASGSLSNVPISGGTYQAFNYDTGILVGGLWSASYGTFMGPLSLLEFEYDLNDSTTLATLLEDADGILPSGSATCDITPTVLWDSPGTAGPYLYRWICHVSGSTGAVAASGVTVNTRSVEIPDLEPGPYYFRVLWTSSVGATGEIQALVFTVLDCPFLRDPEVLELDPFDIETVGPSEEDYVRYLPQWMNVHGTATEPASASLLFQLFRPFLQNMREVEQNIIEKLDEAGINSVPARLPRKAWHIQSRFSPREALTATLTASGISQNILRGSSVFEFLTHDDPIFIVGDSGHVLFRNLGLREILVSPEAATGILSRRYRMPFEHEGIVPDSDVLFQFADVWYRIKAGAQGIDPIQAVIQLSAPFSGDILFRYQSNTLADVVRVSVSGSPTITPSRHDLWNRFDELGLVCGLTRRRDEDNKQFRKRIYARFISSQGVHRNSVAQHISQDLTLVSIIDWDGQTTLNLSASGYNAVRYVDVQELPETDHLTEQLVRTSSDYQKYTGTKNNWRSGYLISVDGIPVSPLRYPNMVVSGNTVHFGTNVSGVVVATYGYNNYELTRTSLHTITTVTPVSGNASSGQYRVILSRNVRLNTAADPEYIQESLLNADGTPNEFFLELHTRLLEGSPLHFGRARWLHNARWLERTEDKPLTEHLPSVFDLNS